MKTIKWNESLEQMCAEIIPVLAGGGLVCLPCAGRYRIVADLTNTDAVLGLMQSKSRVKRAPALVFIDREESLGRVTAVVDPLSLKLAQELWPQPLTIRVTPHPGLPPPVLDQLGGKKSKVGVRIPDDSLARAVAAKLARPLLVSSANRERKKGESSPAQVRKTFAGKIDLFVDKGDLRPEVSSTVIDIVKGEVVIERPGAISAETIKRLTDV